MLFGGGEYENHIRRRFLEGLEEGVECRLGEHMHLVDDEDAVAAYGRGYHHLFDEAAYIVDTVVGGGIKLYDVERAVFVELPTGIALVARLAVRGARGAVDCFGENTGARGLAYSAGAAEQVGVGEAVGGDGVFERHRQSLLPDHAAERRRTVFSGRYDILFHVLVQGARHQSAPFAKIHKIIKVTASATVFFEVFTVEERGRNCQVELSPYLPDHRERRMNSDERWRRALSSFYNDLWHC